MTRVTAGTRQMVSAVKPRLAQVEEGELAHGLLPLLEHVLAVGGWLLGLAFPSGRLGSEIDDLGEAVVRMPGKHPTHAVGAVLAGDALEGQFDLAQAPAVDR